MVLETVIAPNNLNPKNLSQKKKISKNFKDENSFGSKETVRQQNFESKEILNPKNFWFRKFWVQNIKGPQNFVSTKFKACKKLGTKSLVKIGSGTAEIFPIWTNVARTNVA